MLIQHKTTRRHGKSHAVFFSYLYENGIFVEKHAKNVQKQTRMLFLDVSYKNIWINLAIVGEK